MSKKRYAIVRVDTECPSHYENINNDFVCADVPKHYIEHCNNCRYGDTKEDFEKKIETAITRIIQRKNIVIKYRNFDISMTIKNLSKTIAQYLGIEK